MSRTNLTYRMGLATLLCGCLLWTIGCGGGDGDAANGNGEGETSKSTGQSTPEEAVTEFQAAVEAEDWGGSLRYLVPGSQDLIVGMMVMTAGFSVLGDEEKTNDLSALLEKHGLSENESQDPDAAQQQLAQVADKPALCDELNAWIKANAEEETMLSSIADDIKSMEIKETSIDGDEATVQVTLDGEESDPVILTRIDGLWYIDMEKMGPPEDMDDGPGQ